MAVEHRPEVCWPYNNANANSIEWKNLSKKCIHSSISMYMTTATQYTMVGLCSLSQWGLPIAWMIQLMHHACTLNVRFVVDEIVHVTSIDVGDHSLTTFSRFLHICGLSTKEKEIVRQRSMRKSTAVEDHYLWNRLQFQIYNLILSKIIRDTDKIATANSQGNIRETMNWIPAQKTPTSPFKTPWRYWWGGRGRGGRRGG